jgi:hypothetical protein
VHDALEAGRQDAPGDDHRRELVRSDGESHAAAPPPARLTYRVSEGPDGGSHRGSSGTHCQLVMSASSPVPPGSPSLP